MSEKDDVVKDEVEAIEEELTANLAKEDKRKTKKAKVREDSEEEAVDDLVSEMQDNAIKKYGRGPGVPSSRERRRRDIVANSQGRSKIHWSVPDIAPPTKNPRQSRRDDGIDGRRRERIWKARERLGVPCRRPIIDAEGKDTGGTTSSLG